MKISSRRLRLEALEDRTVPSGTPRMVLDNNSWTLSSFPHEFTAVGSTAYFFARDGYGHTVPIPTSFDGPYGLWKSDGTAAGTTLVKDLTNDFTTAPQVAMNSRT